MAATVLAGLGARVSAGVLARARLAPAGTAAGGAGALRRGLASGPADVADRVCAVVKNFEKVPADKVSPSASFQGDLGLDSLDTVEVVMAIEEEFAIEIPDADADKILSCADAIKYLEGHPQAK